MPPTLVRWYTLQRGGYALIASGALLLALILWSIFFNTDPNALPPVPYLLLDALAYALLLVGLPAIYAMQPPSDRVQQAGFICIAVGSALSVLGLLLAGFGVKSLPGIIIWAYLICDMFGYLVVGWVTAGASFRPRQARDAAKLNVFPTWVGWVLLAAGAATLLFGPGYTEILLLFSLVGFGVTIVRATQRGATGLAGAQPTDEIMDDEPAADDPVMDEVSDDDETLHDETLDKPSVEPHA